MPRVVQLGLIIALAASVGFGQRPGGVPLGNPLPPLSPIPPFSGSPRPQFAPQRVPQRGARSAGFYSLPYYPIAAYGAPAEPAPGGVTIIQQFAPPLPIVAAEEPPAVTPQIHEYPAPAVPPSAAAQEAAQATFAIVLKNGQVLSATIATVQGNALQIVDPEDEHHRVPLDSIDREATRRRNAERNLRLQLQ
jgi:hypothetical protein